MEPAGGRAVALVDCDSFYASCEQLMNPTLIGKPVVVMSNNDGCIVARSKEAKILGVKMGMPVFQAKKLYPDVYYISGRLGLYGDISDRVMSVLKDFSPVVEIYSIDEAFIDLTGLRRLYRKSYLEIAEDIKLTVKKKVGIPVSVGISLTKVLAKLATERAKKSNGYYYIRFCNISTELKQTDLIDIWGIGSNTVALLNKFGVYTAYQFTLQNEAWIRKTLGKKGLELKSELEGYSVYPVTDKTEKPQSIQKTSSFATFTADFDYIKNSLHYHAHRACKKLRKLGLKTQLVGIMLRTKDFKIHYGNNVLISPSNWELEMFNTIDKVLPEIILPDVIYRSSGIILSNFTEISGSQLSIFETVEERQKKDHLGNIWDRLESKYGRGVLSAGTMFYTHNKMEN